MNIFKNIHSSLWNYCVVYIGLFNTLPPPLINIDIHNCCDTSIKGDKFLLSISQSVSRAEHCDTKERSLYEATLNYHFIHCWIRFCFSIYGSVSCRADVNNSAVFIYLTQEYRSRFASRASAPTDARGILSWVNSALNELNLILIGYLNSMSA